MPTHRRSLLAAWTATWTAGMAAALLPSSALADPLGADERRAVRATIEAQLQALAAGDSARAFGQASPAIRRQFGDADSFFTMVQQGYPMVIRPASTAFFEPERRDGAVLQVVQLRDATGRSWLVTYQLLRLDDQPGRPWRINGVVVVAADPGKSST